ncbi:MAG: CHAT domain-containing tetratricopeptide repeat protein [Parasphingorhabdus sp.]|uniref:CHAT domain-containing protein n=1 Tax=Parasphingorhabdus sp. TaxID=2709688 RepID=UPI003001D5C8
MIRLNNRYMAALLCSISAAALLSQPVMARDLPLSVQDSFRIGSRGVLCTAQNAPNLPELAGMFDRGYRIVCRDAATSVGTFLALRDIATDPVALVGFEELDHLACRKEGEATIEHLGTVSSTICTNSETRIDHRIYSTERGSTTYIAQGLAGYDSALRLGLAALVSDQPVEGAVEVATTSVSDPVAFARIQAGSLDIEGARTEAYSRNHSGSYAEAAEFFETLVARDSGSTGRTAEFLANQGLQQSNLGNFASAQALFDRADTAVAARDGVTQRLIRNFRTIHLLNQQKADDAIGLLERPVVRISEGVDGNVVSSGEITSELSVQINRENENLRRVGGFDSGLSDFERGQILDGQASHLRGVALRINKDFEAAADAQNTALQTIESVRDGRVTSTAWLRSDIRSELALTAEFAGNLDAAKSHFSQAIAIVETAYPQSPALLAAKARLAGFLGRSGSVDAALALYATVVEDSSSVPGAAVVMRDLLGPYFELLIALPENDAAPSAAMFLASQALQRPGVAQTQAALARELSEGDDEASALFRLAVSRMREIARTTSQIAQLSSKAFPNANELRDLGYARDALTSLALEQTQLQSQLSQFPRYRVLVPQVMQLGEMQALLRTGEAYYKVNIVGDAIYSILVTPEDVRSFKVPDSLQALQQTVNDLRDSIVRIEYGATATYPFNVELARLLYLSLLGPVEEQLSYVTHLIYEPDGPLLQLPPYLLVEDQASVDAYVERTQDIDSDLFDFTGIQWFGKGRDMSIAVSPRSFAEVRAIAPSTGKFRYLGLGENAVPDASLQYAATQDDQCQWGTETWGNPISSSELNLARNIIGSSKSNVITGADFSDSALLAQDDLNEYRIIHFATHGLVTAPKPQCMARPALVTSFGGEASDGLLSFQEIFDLQLDADVVILSACDTAGMASVGASREAGVATGGNYALDGLVRAFVGAGARSVVASHWPVPDDFDATQRLIGGMFGAENGMPLASSLRLAQEKLMNDPRTSHPYYWAAFVVLGDGAKPLLTEE